MPDLPRQAVVALGCVIAVVANLIVYGAGRAAGGTFRFTAPTGHFDTASTATLAVCHLTLVPISIAAVLAIGRRTQATAS